ncbi:uridine 5p-monophosphate synthase [Biomphalaria glabrata]|nr:uridine 5'-monophosphate synthase-like; partial [Biomphalaria glabrata]KAI8784002.1 uridine 5-monophosphate synthase [Biomphalaria glabrata]
MAACMNSAIQSLILRLHEINAVKFGDFKLKSGIQSPVYFDLRVIISYPDVMVNVANLLWEKVAHCNYQSVCGVPYTALPFATIISAERHVPMLIRRKEAKSYGTKKLIEGKYEDGDICLIIEDVVSSGLSIMETAEALSNEGVIVKDAVVLLNREQGGYEKLKKAGIELHSVFTITDVLTVLKDADKMSAETVDRVTNYITQNRFNPGQAIQNVANPKTLAYGERAVLCSNPVTQRLFKVMEEKRTNLALSADVTDCKQLLQLVDKTGPYICMVKTHVDILEDFSEDFIAQLKQLADKHNFVIFEDRKFADIGNTVVHQYTRGLYHISEWAHIINAHLLPGPGIVQGLKQAGLSKGRGCLLIAEMSSVGNLATGEYTEACVKVAQENKDFIIGFISLRSLSADPELIHMTPGVQLEEAHDNLGQQYLTPSEVITKRGTDIIIVGRGIYQAKDPAVAARQYQLAGYDAYIARLTDTLTS